MARFTKFTPQRRKRLLDNLAAGLPIKAACARAGIHHSTFYAWIEQGRTDEPDPAYEQFADDADISLGLANADTWEAFIRDAREPRGKGNWLPWFKILLARWPGDFAAGGRIEVDQGRGGGPVQVVWRFDPSPEPVADEQP